MKTVREQVATTETIGETALLPACRRCSPSQESVKPTS